MFAMHRFPPVCVSLRIDHINSKQRGRTAALCFPRVSRGEEREILMVGRLEKCGGLGGVLWGGGGIVDQSSHD